MKIDELLLSGDGHQSILTCGFINPLMVSRDGMADHADDKNPM